MPTQVLFLGLDAADADLIDRWAADGALPNLAALGQRQVTSRMESTAGMFPGGVWFELTSGRLAQHSGRFFETRVLPDRRGQDAPGDGDRSRYRGHLLAACEQRRAAGRRRRHPPHLAR